MTTQTVSKRISWFGLVVALPAVGCVAALAYMAFTLEHNALSAVFALVGVTACYASSRIH